ncbi:MAG TPA: MBL fold metallo-hydrolase, partial [Longimicrobiales bacterium]|nr:MBL fold metallo-hydrolase [Longimicrobiales bacterium]
MRIAATLLVCLSVVSTIQAQQRTSAQRVIDAAARALGGAEAIRSVRTLVLEGIGDNFFLGQSPKPDAPLPRFEVIEFRRTIDLKSGRWWQDQTREPRFAVGNPTRTRQITALDGDIAFNPEPKGGGTRASAEIATARRHELYQYPLTMLQLALGDDAKLSDVRQVENEQLVTVSTAAGLNLTLGIASNTNLPTRISFKTSHPNLGDVESTVEFSEYRTVGDLELPHRLIAKIDGVTVADIKLARTRVNLDIGDLAAPAELRTAASAGPAVKVEVEELADGVWRLGGGSHHSIVIEFRDHMMMIEAPLGDARTMAVIQRARELRPSKPLTRVVMTHHHFDHSAGIRAAVAENLAIITHEGNVAFVREMLGRPHTIAPDELARRPNAKPRI